MMETMWMMMAAIGTALALWLYMRSGNSRRRLPVLADSDQSEMNPPDDAVQTMLILRLLRVVLEQGSSIPDACEAVGNAVGGRSGRALEDIGRKLKRGVTWPDAWRVAERQNIDGLHVFRAALEPAWLHGDAPSARLESALEQLDSDERSSIEQEGARLSVKLLMPTGLCFLPAFIAVGVIPSIASFVV